LAPEALALFKKDKKGRPIINFEVDIAVVTSSQVVLVEVKSNPDDAFSAMEHQLRRAGN
jgi:hypothetical protein